jgi:hypothetical protein
LDKEEKEALYRLQSLGKAIIDYSGPGGFLGLAKFKIIGV